METNFTSRLTELLETSQVIRSVQGLKANTSPSRLFGDAVRPLSEKEIDFLTSQGCISSDWSLVLVAPGFRPDFIRHTTITGRCVLGVFSGIDREIAPGISVPSGIYDSSLVSCEIGHECCIKLCGLLANYCINNNAVIFHTGLISAKKNCTFGNGLKIPVGMETGGREVASCAEIDIKIAETVALGRHDKNLLECYEDFINRYCRSVACDFGVIEAGAAVRNTPEILNTYIGEGACINGATFIENCTILSGPGEPTEVSRGAYVKDSCVQWGCEISSMAIVVTSLLTEHSHVERHGKVTASIIGPNTAIAEGEVTSCLVGPFVGFHHQALLISALWPEGKGNVAYGANVGSNHTSRAPDQEVFCGEGVFFGLGSNIKFPADFSQAPYSIFATGVNALPQKIEYPFSLIQSPTLHFDGISPSYNEIVPAWVLSDNIYMLLRNEGKYKKRNKAKRTSFDLSVFRPEIIEKMIMARGRLSAIKMKKAIYTDKDLPGLGKNVLKEEKRCRAIDAYTTYIEYYCLSGLRNRIDAIVKTTGKKLLLDSVYAEKTEDALWEHQRNLLVQEGFGAKTIHQNLERLIAILENLAHDAFVAKEKDDSRGAAIIPNFHHANTRASEDSFIIDLSRQTKEATLKIREMISLL
jgi:carbonic anhydrase/acetyltransferase-like protein (isoleucine patch superfamily)